MIDKTLMKDPSTGNLRTQSLFLEAGYSPHAIYTLKDEDYEYKGKTYPSVKRLYLEAEDLTEYDFATEHFYSWDQWSRIVANKQLTPYVEGWRRELEMKLRARALKQVQKSALGGNMVAQKYMADKGWDKKVGRPSKADIAEKKAIEAGIVKEFKSDLARFKGE